LTRKAPPAEDWVDMAIAKGKAAGATRIKVGRNRVEFGFDREALDKGEPINDFDARPVLPVKRERQ
jgi:hypothetical protein